MSVLSRSSEASTLRLIVSGRLSRPRLWPSVEVESELRGDHDLVADGLERLAHELLVRERPVHLRGVEEGHATFDGRPDQGDHLLPVGKRRVVAEAHPHAAEPDGRHFQLTVSKRALLHRPSCDLRLSSWALKHALAPPDRPC